MSSQGIRQRREPSGVQLRQIVFIRLPDHLPLEFERSCDEARLGGPWIWYQLDFGWCLELLQSCLLRSLEYRKWMSVLETVVPTGCRICLTATLNLLLD